MKLCVERWYRTAANVSLSAITKLSVKCWCFATCPFHVMVPKAGLEPARSRPRGILSPLRLPFRHFGSFWRHHPDSDWGIKVLQTSALPLGYGAITLYNMYRPRDGIHIFVKDHPLKGDETLERESDARFASGTYAALRCGPCGSNALHLLLRNGIPSGENYGAGDGIRTRDICLGKATLYH